MVSRFLPPIPGRRGLLAIRQEVPRREGFRGGPVGVPESLGEEPPSALGGAVRVADPAVATSFRRVAGVGEECRELEHFDLLSILSTSLCRVPCHFWWGFMPGPLSFTWLPPPTHECALEVRLALDGPHHIT